MSFIADPPGFLTTSRRDIVWRKGSVLGRVPLSGDVGVGLSQAFFSFEGLHR